MAPKPFSPNDARATQQNNVPDEIIAAVNTLLAKAGGGPCKISNFEITQEASKFGLRPVNIDLSTYKSWFKFEELYRQQGWHVQFLKEENRWEFTPA